MSSASSRKSATRPHVLPRLNEGGAVGIVLICLHTCQIVADRLRQYEVAVGQTLHQGAGAEPVGAMVREVGLADDEEAGDRTLELVVDPEPAHGVVNGRIDAHGHLVRVLGGDALVHIEKVTVAFANNLGAQTLDRLTEVEVHAEPARSDAAALV